MAVYCSGDWHGSEIGFKVLEFLRPEDKLYFLGDAADRGPVGFELMEKLLADSRVCYLKGNHEDMLVKALFFQNKRSLLHWVDNGGEVTWDAIERKMKEDKSFNLSDFLNIIEKLPTEVTYTNKNNDTIILEHAGYTVGDVPHRSHDPLWDREHFLDEWPEDEDATYIVHGHTPVQYLEFMFGYKDQPPKTKEDIRRKTEWLNSKISTWKPEVLRYCGGHKFDVDMCTVVSDRIALLNLDTFETIYFDKEEFNKSDTH